MILKDQLSQFSGGDAHALLDGDGNGQAPSEQELSNEYAAPGDKALLPLGITYSANWKLYADGISKHAREQVLALAATGLPVGLRSLGSQALLTGELHPDVLEVAYLENVTFSATAIAIKHVILSDPGTLRAIICPGASTLSEELIDTVFRSTIVYTSLERSCVSQDFVRIFNKLGQVWVPCDTNYEALRDSGVDVRRIRVIPYPYDPSKAAIAAPRGREDDVPKGWRFYNIGKWEPRKNQHRLIGGFLLAFTPKDKASLLIKTSPFGGGWAGYPSPEESVEFWLGEPDVQSNGWTKENINRLLRIIDQKIPEKDLIEIHRRNNIYVSPSCGEAWDIPAFEAKLAGNRLVHVGYGGSEEYYTDDDVEILAREAPVHPGYGWEKDATWEEATVEDVRDALRLVEPPVRRVVPPEYARLFSRHAVGNLMKAALEDLADELGCRQVLTVGGFG